MSARRRRTPLGTQPPVTSEGQSEAAGTIEAQTERVPKEDADANLSEAQQSADQEHSVIVQIDDDWLERLDLPPD